MDQKLLLASGSAARKALLAQLDITFETTSHEVDERAIAATHPDPETLSLALAQAKALDASRRNPGRMVIGSDQVCACEGRVFHKPETRAQAVRDLQALRGRTHQLFSSVAVARNGEILFSACERADMTMRPFSDVFLEHYLDMAGDDVLWCCGVYQSEQHALLLFERMMGRQDVIMGMPMLPLLAFLREQGILEV